MEDPELSSPSFPLPLSLSLSLSFFVSLTGEKLNSFTLTHAHQAGSVHRHIPHWRGHP